MFGLIFAGVNLLVCLKSACLPVFIYSVLVFLFLALISQDPTCTTAAAARR